MNWQESVDIEQDSNLEQGENLYLYVINQPSFYNNKKYPNNLVKVIVDFSHNFIFFHQYYNPLKIDNMSWNTV